jgi:putative inorganic carbon (hco3(-)) transporter
MVWINITTYFGKAPQFMIDEKYDIVQKTFLGAIAVCVFLNSRVRIEGLIIVIIATVGFYIGRGLIITILTGGSGLFVIGTEGTVLGDRNNFALVVWTLIPMLMWLSGYTLACGEPDLAGAVPGVRVLS